MRILYRFMPYVAEGIASVFLDRARTGGTIPAEGACLIVGTHHSGNFDPPILAGVSGRPVTFLAKAPLFRDWRFAWVVRSAGAVPVYRPRDGRGHTSRNQGMFREAKRRLEEGGCLGVFPEGGSVAGDTLGPVKTGAARIALQASETIGYFPIIPVSIRRVDGFWRRPTRIHVGRPVEWRDLVGGETAELERMHRLTARIREALERGLRLCSGPTLAEPHAVRRFQRAMATEATSISG